MVILDLDPFIGTGENIPGWLPIGRAIFIQVSGK